MAQKQKCSYLAVKTASAFMYRPTDEWKIPEPSYVFDKGKSMTEQQREEQRSTPEWLRGWAEIKVQGTGKKRGRYVPKRPQIVNTAETTLQEALRLSGYSPLSKEAMIAVLARRSGRAPDAMKSVAAGPEPVLMPAAPDMELRYCSTSRAGVAGLGAPKSAVEQEQDPEGGDGGEGAVAGADGHSAGEWRGRRHAGALATKEARDQAGKQEKGGRNGGRTRGGGRRGGACAEKKEVLKGTQVVDRDSDQRTAALVTAVWRAAWIWRWF